MTTDLAVPSDPVARPASPPSPSPDPASDPAAAAAGTAAATEAGFAAGASPPSPTGGGASAERRHACAALSRAVALDDAAFRRLYPRLTPEEVWARLVAGEVPADLAAATRRAVAAADPQRDLDAVAALGGRLVCPGDEEWPEALDDLGDRRPLALWVRGPVSLRELAARAVAIVGSRAATPYGNQVAAELAVELGERGWSTVSGGAYGIDAAAHRGALAAGALTAAVLACGVDVSYPSGNRRLFDDIADAGLLVSEWPPRSSPTRLRFLWRNRAIAALGRGTVVVEMGHRSGARRTCTEATRLGRYVMAMPGPVTSPVSVGCHGLLRSREAELVTSAREVLELVGRLDDAAEPEPEDAATLRDRLGREAQRVLDALDPLEFLTPEQVGAESQQDPARLDVLLDALCEHDLVVRSDGRYRLGPAALEGVRRSA
jgi:DNA processing protein